MKRRGILLLTTILITLVVIMVVGAAIRLAPTALISASNYNDSHRATLALDIGLEYAQNRLREDMTWSGSPSSGPTTVVQTPDDSLVVVEDHGNVIGTVRFDSGQFGQFRIRFNHQDGSGGIDGLEDPSQAYKTDLGAISQNNLTTSSSHSLYRDSQGTIQEREDVVQPFQAFIAVEGRAGPALRNSDSSNPNDLLDQQRLVARVAEVRLEASFGETLDAAAMAGGNLDAYMRQSLDTTHRTRDLQLDIGSAWSNGSKPTPRIRTKGSLSVDTDQPVSSGVNLATEEGVLNTGSGDVSSTTVTNSGTTVSTEEPSADFYNLEWDEVNRSSSNPADPDTVNLKAGTYVVEESSSGEPQIRYFDMGLDDYLAASKDPTTPLPSVVLDRDLKQARNNYSAGRSNAIVLHHTDHVANTKASPELHAQLLIRDDVYVEATGNTSEFNFIPARGYVDGPPVSATEPNPGDVNPQASYGTRSIMFQFVPRDEGQSTFTCPGDIHIHSQVHGYGGSITSEKDISLVGAGTLSANTISDGGDGLSLYAKGDINVNTYLPKNQNHTGGRYGNMSLRGVIYAWGDINFQLGPPRNDTTPPTFYGSNGYLLFEGSMVAYGGDPGDATNNSPGSGSGGVGSNKGNINISAHYARIKYDPKYLMSLDKLASPAGLGVVSYTLHQSSNPNLK